MDFFLPFHIQSYPFNISYTDKILFIGSCFSGEIGNKMAGLKFEVLQNPSGILYDPVSIADALFSYIENKPFTETSLFELNGLWHSWKHHSIFSGVDKKEVLKKINRNRSAAHRFLKQAKVLIITVGTAFHYQLKSTGEHVVNCHKAPADHFIKTLSSVEEMKPDLLSAFSALRILNPTIKIIFTVSPVRHVRDGVIENNRSKSRLIETVHSIAGEQESVFYFPSYELVTDVLRDYRFYKNDLVHPNETAVNFVFRKFCDSFLDELSEAVMREIERVIAAVNHHPFLKESAAHQKFMASQLANINKIESKYPFINLSEEKKYFANFSS